MEQPEIKNQLIAVGHLGRDVEMKQTGNRKIYCEFTLAIDNWSKDKDGEFQNEPCWVNCKAWKDTAGSMQNLKKGAKIRITGKLTQENWTDKQTQQARSKLVVIVFEWQPVERKQ